MLLNSDQARRLAGILLEDEVEAPQPGAALGGRTFGNYRVSRLIGVGGMGEVYEAQQDKTGRRVAIKVIRSELISADLHRRFEHEVRLLARLQHPGIAQVYEAGRVETASGNTPYFAMEFVEGRTLTKYAADQKLSIRERLDLFLKICDAVEHAHRKGVIHRDLKPANILIDSSGQPRILDFGVARATDADIQATTLHTDIGRVIGTLPYMSPEQISGDPDALDTRSDVYSLGVILYELLAGKPPYDVSRAQIHEAARVIKEQDPTRLSTLDRSLRGDLETIVGKALEKEKERRYQGVAELAGDVRRFLAREPVLARRPSAWYQLSRFAQRNRLLVAATLTIVVVLAAATATSLSLLVQQNRTLLLLSAAQESEKRERVAADGHRVVAEHEAAIARAVNSFLDDLISSPDPTKEGRDIKVIDVLDGAMEKADARFSDQPDVGAAVVLDVGRLYLALGDYDRAGELMSHALATLQTSLGPDHPDTLNAQADVAAVLCQKGDYAGARDLLAPVVAKQAISPGPRDPDTLQTLDVWMLVLNALGQSEEAAEIGRRNVALTAEVLGPDKPETLQRQANFAAVLMELHQWKEAGDILDSAVTVGKRVLGRRDPRVSAALQNLAVARRNQGHTDEAETALREAIAIDEDVLGKRHPQTLSGYHNLATLLYRTGKKDEALKLMEEALALHREVLGPDHMHTIVVESSVATMLADAGRLDESVAAYRHVLDVRLKTVGEHHQATVRAMFDLARTLEDQHTYDESIALYKRLIPLVRQLPDDGKAKASIYTVDLGVCLMEAGKTAEAEEQLLAAYAALSSQPDLQSNARTAARALGELYRKTGRDNDAATYRALGAEPATPPSANKEPTPDQ